MSFFKTSDGSQVDGSQGYSSGGGMEPIPHGTQVTVMIESAAWKTGQDGLDRVKTRARVVDGEYSNRVVFDTLDICSQDQKRRDKHIKKFATVDHAAKTGIVNAGEAPTDEQLYGLVGTELVYTMGIFVPKSLDGSVPEPVQYVMGISIVSNKPTPKRSKKPATSLSDDVPF